MHTRLVSALLPALRRLDAERAHGLALAALRAGLAGGSPATEDPALSLDLFGRRFANPIGLAAGFDKNAVAVAPLSRLGFGFIETGTVTPLPQDGNPRPRMFRLREDRAVINRLGFNNQGLGAYVARLAAVRHRTLPLGANVGINKSGAEPLRDYPALVAAVAPHVDYVTINVSSPNTPGLRALQGGAALGGILRAIAAQVPRPPPLLVKLAPDLDEAALEAIVQTVIEAGGQGLILGNTTLARPASLRGGRRNEAGGLSGPPLMQPSTRLLAQAARLAAGRLVLVGCGGVASGADVLAKIRAGAHLVQLYTAFAYEGPALIPRLVRELAASLREQGYRSVTDARGTAGL